MPETSAITFHTAATESLDQADRAAVEALFARNYRDADLDYLRDALRQLRTATLARDGDRVVGFAIGETRRLDLPRLPDQVVRLAGLACVDPAYRRRHLMVALNGRTLMREYPDEPGLACGRMAHPATFRLMGQLATAVPRPGVPPTPWQREIGRVIAAAYGVHDFDPDTFVCRGRGRPIGYPVIDIDATPEEWAAFREVDRDRGDSLLGFAWFGSPPPGW